MDNIPFMYDPFIMCATLILQFGLASMYFIHVYIKWLWRCFQVANAHIAHSLTGAVGVNMAALMCYEYRMYCLEKDTVWQITSKPSWAIYISLITKYNPFHKPLYLRKHSKPLFQLFCATIAAFIFKFV